MQHRLLALLFICLFVVSAPSYARTYHLVTAPFKPFTNPDHPKGGFLVEVARQALALRGHQLEISYRPWARAMREAEIGQYDGLLSAFYNDERAKLFHFSAPLNTTKMVLVGLRSRLRPLTRYTSLSQLKNHRIAVGRKWAYSKEFDSNKELLKTIVNDEPSGIRMLYNHRVSLFAVNIDQFYATIATMDDFNVKRAIVLEPPLSTNDQHIAATRRSKDSATFLNEFNTGLAALKASGGYDKIKNSFFGF